MAFGAEAPSRFAKLDGTRIHYQSYGTGKQAVVFIHGWTCDLTFWRLQAPVYEKRRSLLIDLPGHGLSDKPEIAYTQELFARAVDAVMRDAGVERAVLVGHSMGTPVSLTFLKLYPEKVSGLASWTASLRGRPRMTQSARKKTAQSAEMVKTYRSPEYKSAMDHMFSVMFTDKTSTALREQIRGKMLATPQYVMASAMEGMMALEPPAAGTHFNPPAAAFMVKRAAQSGYEDYLRSLFPNLRTYQEWEGAGHFLMMEQPERFNTALTEFLDYK